MRRATIYSARASQLRRYTLKRNVAENLVRTFIQSEEENKNEEENKQDEERSRAGDSVASDHEFDDDTEDIFDKLCSRVPMMRTLFPEAQGQIEYMEGDEADASSDHDVEPDAIDELPVVFFENDDGNVVIAEDNDDTWGSEPGDPPTHDSSCDCFRCARERLRQEQWQFPYDRYDPSSFINEEEERERRSKAAAAKGEEKDNVKRAVEIELKENKRLSIGMVFSAPPPIEQRETKKASPCHEKKTDWSPRRRVFFRPSEVSAMKLSAVVPSPKAAVPSVSSVDPEENIVPPIFFRPPQVSETVVTVASTVPSRALRPRVTNRNVWKP